MVSSSGVKQAIYVAYASRESLLACRHLEVDPCGPRSVPKTHFSAFLAIVCIFLVLFLSEEYRRLCFLFGSLTSRYFLNLGGLDFRFFLLKARIIRRTDPSFLFLFCSLSLCFYQSILSINRIFCLYSWYVHTHTHIYISYILRGEERDYD